MSHLELEMSGISGMLLTQKRKQSLCGIYSEGEFRAVLEHERKRADRTGEKFSLALFDIDPTDEDVTQACLVPDAITEAVRSTDVVGWFDKHHIGVLLVDTPWEGACKVVEKFSKKMGLGTHPMAYHLFTYPSHYFPEPATPVETGTDPSYRFRQISLFEEGDLFAGAKDSRDNCYAEGPISPEKGKGLPSPSAVLLETHLGIRVPLWKSMFDVAVATVALILLMPFMVLIAVLIKSFSPGPVLFRQGRIGYLGRPFTLLKFRTMKADTDPSEHDGYVRGLIRSETVMKKLPQSARLIPLGRFLRSSGMDELPQLFHVLSGKMSLVGPRPCLPGEFQEYLHWHKRRFFTLPGITGLWQVEGKNKMTFQEMIRKDIAYEQKRSLKMDLAILWKTIPAVVMLMSDG